MSSESPRVAFDARCLGPGYPGVGRYAYELLLSLPDAGTRTTAVVPPDFDDRFDRAALEAAGVHCHPSTIPMRSLGEQRGLPDIGNQLDADVWHAPFYVTAYGARRPLVVTIFDTIGLDRSELMPSWRKRLAIRFLLRLAVRTAHRVLTLSSHARDDLVARLGVDADRIVVTPAAAGRAFRPDPQADGRALRHRWGLPARFVLSVGAEKPHKNFGRLRDAWCRLPAGRRRDTALVLAGPRAASPGPRHGDRDGIRDLGPVDDAALIELYRSAELVAVPSLQEGFGLPVLEAMACGTPVACARVSSLPEVAADAAAYFDPRDTDSIARVLDALLADPGRRASLARAGLARAASFSWHRTAEATSAAYRRAAREARAERSP